MTECHDDVCITCSDELRSVRVEAVSEDGTRATVRDGEAAREVSIELVDGVRVGDLILTHGGVALQHAPEELAATASPAAGTDMEAAG